MLHTMLMSAKNEGVDLSFLTQDYWNCIRRNVTIPSQRYEKIAGRKFSHCHLSTCPKHFLTPKARRLHLIEAHGYPKEYFFAVTNKGVGGLLKKWGEGASLVRKPWKARATNGQGAEDDEDEDEGGSNVDEAEEEKEEGNSVQYASRSTRSSHPAQEPLSPRVVIEDDDDDEPVEGGGEEPEDDLLNSVMKSMGSLSLVPSSIQFGRGAKRGGFAPHNHHDHPPHHPNQMNVDHPPSRSHRGRGRGRGRGANPSTNPNFIPLIPTTSSVSRAPPPMMPRGLGGRGSGRASFQRGRGRAGGPSGRGGPGAPVTILTRDRS